MTAEQYYQENIHRPEIDWYGEKEITLTLMKEFALIKCAEQREICAEYAIFEAEINNILNAENPEM